MPHTTAAELNKAAAQQMMLGIDSRLHIVADNPSSPAMGAIARASGSVSEIW